MAGSYLPSIFTRGNEGLGSLFREIEKTFDDFSRRSPLMGFAGFGDGPAAPKIDVAYCLIYECYPDGAIDGDDLTSTDRLSLAAFQAGLTAGAVGGSGPS